MTAKNGWQGLSTVIHSPFQYISSKLLPAVEGEILSQAEAAEWAFMETEYVS